MDSLGWAYYRLGRTDDALKALERAIALVPDDPVIHEHAGEIYLRKGQAAEAKEAWIRALELDPANTKLLARFKEAGFSDTAATDRIERARQKAPTP